MMRKYISILFREDVILGFVWVTLGYTFVYALAMAQYTNAFVVALTIILTLIPTLLRRRYEIRLPRAISLFSVLFAYATLFFGEIHNFYERLWWWDLLLHGGSAIMFGLIGLGALRMMLSTEKVTASSGIMSVFAFTFAVAIGALWEIIEFVIDMTLDTNMQKSGLTDTMSDLIVDALGALIVVTLAYLHWRFEWKNIIGRWVDDFIAQRNMHR